jgi:hypothetical protein
LAGEVGDEDAVHHVDVVHQPHGLVVLCAACLVQRARRLAQQRHHLGICPRFVAEQGAQCGVWNGCVWLRHGEIQYKKYTCRLFGIVYLLQ